MSTERTKVFAANDPHIHINPDDDSGLARFAAAAIATRLYNLGRWNGVDRLVFQYDPLALQVMPIDQLDEGDEYTIEGAHGDLYDLLDTETDHDADTEQVIPVISAPANGVALPDDDPLFDAELVEGDINRRIAAELAADDGWDTDGDPVASGRIHPDPLPLHIEPELGFSTHSFDDLPTLAEFEAHEAETADWLRAHGCTDTTSQPDSAANGARHADEDAIDPPLPFTPSAAAEQMREQSQTLDAMFDEMRRQLVDLNEQLADALAINRLQSDMLREVTTPRRTRIEVTTLVQNIDTQRARADDELAEHRSDGWQAVSYGYPHEPDTYRIRIVTLEREVPADPIPQREASAASYADALFANAAPSPQSRVIIQEAVPVSFSTSEVPSFRHLDAIRKHGLGAALAQLDADVITAAKTNFEAAAAFIPLPLLKEPVQP